MGLFSFESPESKMRSRMGPVKAIADRLNADYYHGIEEVKDTFFPSINDEMKNSNVIVGESEGYRYCFIEYYHRGRGKNDHSKWISRIALRLNEEDFPDFDLSSKSSALFSVGCFIAFALPFGIVPLIMLTSFIFMFLNNKAIPKDSQLIPIIIGLGFLFFTLIFGAISFFIINYALKTYKQINSQGKYCISNPKFRDKYVILTDSDEYRIRKVFNEKVCSRIVDFNPEISSISIQNNCIQKGCDYNEQLSYPLCLKYINQLVKEAQIFEKDESEYYSSF